MVYWKQQSTEYAKEVGGALYFHHFDYRGYIFGCECRDSCTLCPFGATAGSFIPGLGTIVGAVVGFGVGIALDLLFNHIQQKYVDPALRNN